MSILKSSSFEYIIAEIESLLNYGIQSQDPNSLNSLFKSRISFDLNDIWHLYSKCINKIINLVEEYENNYYKFGEINKNLCSFFCFLKQHYQHINCYSLNYDEVLSKVLRLHPSCCDLNDNELFNYNYSALRRKQITYLNLHGSIHLSSRMVGFFRQVEHRTIPQHIDNAILQAGGNPKEPIIFTPIITGYNKSQRIIASHFSFPLNSFINDLSDSDMLLYVGYSFSDPHINSLIRQYSKNNNSKHIIITLEKGTVYKSQFEQSFESVIGLATSYKEDSDKDDYYIWDSPQMNTYKRGFENFIMSSKNWSRLIK